MPKPDDVASPTESIQSLPAAATALRLPKHRHVSLGGDSEKHTPGHHAAHAHAHAHTHSHPRAARPLPLSQSEASLPIRRAPTPTAALMYASTLTPPGSRAMSPVGRVRSPGVDSPAHERTKRESREPRERRSSSVSTMSGPPPVGAAPTRALLDSPAAETPGEPLRLLLEAFVPHVAVYASRDTDELLREKGFGRGLWELLRPFGEQVQGRVMVRDSTGASHAREDFAVRFVPFGEGIEMPQPVHGVVQAPPTAPSLFGLRRTAEPGGASGNTPPPPRRRTASRAASGDTRIPLVEAVVERHLRFAERSFLGMPSVPSATGQPLPLPTPTAQQHDLGLDAEVTSPYYSLYLRRLLSGLPVACHETFAHPVACVIAISSRNGSPIQTFQELYRDISQGDRRLPPWVDGEFLRYYVLVHDEERGDIGESMALFEKMKRSLGLHCHLLRLRSTQGAETDDDSVALPRSAWMTAGEEYADLERSERWEGGDEADEDDEDNEDDEGTDDADDADDEYNPTRYIFESDATAIRTFVREMVTQSIVPTMERNTAVWNDQVASKRRGLSGRFMSLSKRWGGGGGSGGSSSSGGNNNYQAAQGYYAAGAAEAQLRKLADYAFMLRDWKLALATYDLVRGDFANDKAWKYHAAAHEMAALSTLLAAPAVAAARTKLEVIGGLLEQAYYSYFTRCGSAYGALRSAALGLELLRLRGGGAAEAAAVSWSMRLLEARLCGAVGDALLRERVAACCLARPPAGPGPLVAWGSWRRKAAFWSVLAADAWLAQSKYIQAQRCLNEARRAYSLLQSDDGIARFGRASAFLGGLQRRLRQGVAEVEADEAEEDEEDEADETKETDEADEADETDDGANLGAAHATAHDDPPVEPLQTPADFIARRRSRASSLLGGAPAGQAGLETAPLHSQAADAAEHGTGTDGFGQV